MAHALPFSVLAFTNATRSSPLLRALHSVALAVPLANKTAFSTVRTHSEALVRDIRTATDDNDLRQALDVAVDGDDFIKGAVALAEIGRSRTARLLVWLMRHTRGDAFAPGGRGLRPRARARVEAGNRLFAVAAASVRKFSAPPGAESISVDEQIVRQAVRELVGPTVPLSVAELGTRGLRGLVAFWVVNELAYVPVREVPLWLEEALSQHFEDGAYALLRILASTPQIVVSEEEVPLADRLDLEHLDEETRQARDRFRATAPQTIGGG